MNHVSYLNCHVNLIRGLADYHVQNLVHQSHFHSICADTFQGWILKGDDDDVLNWNIHAFIETVNLAAQHGQLRIYYSMNQVYHSNFNDSLPIVLLLGDSVERYIVDDTCASLKSSVFDWSGNSFKYKRGSSASAA